VKTHKVLLLLLAINYLALSSLLATVILPYLHNTVLAKHLATLFGSFGSNCSLQSSHIARSLITLGRAMPCSRTHFCQHGWISGLSRDTHRQKGYTQLGSFGTNRDLISAFLPYASCCGDAA